LDWRLESIFGVTKEIFILKKMDNQDPPYWKQYSANAVRGIIAAVCCAAIFIIFGLLNKYRWRPPQDEIAVSYKKTDSHIKLAENKKEGADNPVFVD